MIARGSQKRSACQRWRTRSTGPSPVRRRLKQLLACSLFLSIAQRPVAAAPPSGSEPAPPDPQSNGAEPTAVTEEAEPPVADGIPSVEIVERCATDHERARLLRLEGKLVEARPPLRACSDPVCPVALRADCKAWLAEVDALMPTIVLVVDDPDQLGAEVRIDGTRVSVQPDGPIELTPGEHIAELQVPNGPVIKKSFVLRPGTKGVLVRLVAPARPRVAVGGQTGPQVAPTTLSRPIPTSTYALAGSALALLGTSMVLLGSALVDRERANERCAPACGADVTDSIRTRLLLADVAGASAVALGGLAIYTYLERPSVTLSASRIFGRFQVSGDGGRVYLELDTSF